MTRTYKKHDERRSEFLDTAQTLFYSKGYDKTTIEDILAAAKASKGAFYHYFDSKEMLLDSLVDRISDTIMQKLTPIVENPSLSALDKMRLISDTSRTIKRSNAELIRTYLAVLYRDENLVLRHKMQQRSRRLMVPLYSTIIAQGKAEGVFDTPNETEAAECIMSIMTGLQNAVWRLFVDLPDHPENADQLDSIIDFYEDAMERILGAPKKSLDLVHRDHIQEFATPNSSDQSSSPKAPPAQFDYESDKSLRNKMRRKA